MTAPEIGEYKIAWIKGRTMHSQMLDTHGEATAFARANRLRHYTVMRMIDINQGHYRWTLLPDSAGSAILWMHKYYWLVIIIIALLVWQAFFKRR